jgi:photosystem II stability/assembly factor-like uncharacterized protein
MFEGLKKPVHFRKKRVGEIFFVLGASLMLLSACTPASAAPKASATPQPTHLPGAGPATAVPTLEPAAITSATPGGALAVSSSSQVVAVDFVTEQTGWVITTNPDCQPRTGEQTDCSEIIMTDDGGKNWQVQTSTQDPLTSLDFLDQKTGWAYGAHALYATTDGGRSWQLRWNGTGPQSSYQFTDAQNGWAIGSNCPDQPPCSVQLVHSRDGGATWEPVQINGFSPASVFFINPQQGWMAGYTPHPEDNGQPWNLRLSGTQDGGKNWTPLAEVAQTGGRPGSMQSWISVSEGWMLVSDNSICTMGGCWGGLYRTQDGGATWTQLQAGNDWVFKSEGQGQADAYSQAGFPGGLQFVDSQVGWVPIERGAGGAGMGGVALTQDGGLTWTRPLSSPEVSVQSLSVVSTREVWAVAQDVLTETPPYLLHTQDSGQSWKEVNLGEGLSK